jgi:hypothetical protein
MVRDARDINASITDRLGKPSDSRDSVEGAPASLFELPRLGAEAANRQLDSMPVAVEHLAYDLGIALFPDPPSFIRRSLDVESERVGAVGESAREDAL